jgi:hypothetical protein
MADTTLDLTVIGDRACSTTRTYLTYLKSAGFRPRHLWLVDFGPESRRRRMLRRFAGSVVADFLLGGRAASHSALGVVDERYRDLCLHLQEEAGFPPIDHFTEWSPEDFAERVTRLRASDFGDEGLQRRMIADRKRAYLYTNGGIVPGSLLETPGLRVFHIHPGIVPDLRGSDCFLWSAIVRGRLGVSCFYMSAGIDEGSVLGQREFSLPRLPSLAAFMNAEDESLASRALLFAVDPHLRANLFVDVLRSHPGVDLRALPAQPQPRAKRPAYLWMHPRMRLLTMREAFL